MEQRKSYIDNKNCTEQLCYNYSVIHCNKTKLLKEKAQISASKPTWFLLSLCLSPTMIKTKSCNFEKNNFTLVTFTEDAELGIKINSQDLTSC